MLKCKLCGHEAKHRLIEHLVKIHKFNIEEYKTKFGNVISDEYKQAVSNRSINKWKETEYRSKTNTTRNESWTPEKKKLQSDIIKKIYADGHKNWNDGLTKYTDKRVAAIGENNKKCLHGRTKETHEYLKIHSEFMKYRWYNGMASPKMKLLNSEWMTDEEYVIWKNKISTAISNKIMTGEIKTQAGHFKTGYYNGMFYQSGLELHAMKYFENNKNIKSWHRNFDVVLYTDKNGNSRRYLPDFKLILNDNHEIIIEMKGFPDENLAEKTAAAKVKYKNYHVCYSINELEKII